jgi:hypothetical protein
MAQPFINKKSLMKRAELQRNKSYDLGGKRRAIFKRRKLRVISKARLLAGARRPQVFKRIKSAWTRLRRKKVR